MADSEFMVFGCTNPECKKLIKLKRPEKTGNYDVTCPHCGVKKCLRLKGLDQVQSEVTRPDNSQKETVELTDDFIVGREYAFKCPHCETQEIGFTTEKPGMRSIKCPYCKGPIKFEVRKKTERIVLTDRVQMFTGKLVLLRKGWLNKEFILDEGKHLIGRQDKDEPSDISLKNDDSISRRSIMIEVERTSKGYIFKLTVLKATNPVLHNNNPLLPGESISLNFGDTILLGKSKFRFDKNKNKT